MLSGLHESTLGQGGGAIIKLCSWRYSDKGNFNSTQVSLSFKLPHLALLLFYGKEH